MWGWHNLSAFMLTSVDKEWHKEIRGVGGWFERLKLQKNNMFWPDKSSWAIFDIQRPAKKMFLICIVMFSVWTDLEGHLFPFTARSHATWQIGCVFPNLLGYSTVNSLQPHVSSSNIAEYKCEGTKTVRDKLSSDNIFDIYLNSLKRKQTPIFLKV